MWGLILLAGAGIAQPGMPVPVIQTAAAPEQDLTRLQWLTGTWVGEAGGMRMESVYLPAADGEIVGTLRSSADSKPVRYELRTIRIEAGRVVLRVQPFDAAFAPTPAPPAMRLIEAGPDRIAFDGVLLERIGANEMAATITLPGNGGAPRKLRIAYRRVAAIPPAAD